MASLVVRSCFTIATFNFPSSIRVSRRFPLSRLQFGLSRSSPCHRSSFCASSVLGHEAALWTSVQQQIQSQMWMLVPPLLLLAPLLAVKSERQNVVLPLDAWARFFASVPRRQEVERSLVQITILLLLSTAVKSNISAPDPYNYYETIPPDISDQQIRKRIQRPKSPQAERCTSKCVGTCIRGGAGAPGEGPLNVRKPLVVFKEGFRTRQYCLIECSEICNLIEDGTDGP